MARRLCVPLSLVLPLILLGAGLVPVYFSAAQTDSHYFPETQHWIRGRFWSYWQAHGGLLPFGYPLTEEFPEQSRLNGQTYTVQYFERAVLEKHPESAPPFDVQLAQLGTLQLATRYPNHSNPAAAPVPGPLGGQVDLLQAVSAVDSAGTRRFVGVAANHTGMALQGLDILLTLLGADGAPLATGANGEYGVAYLPRGAIFPFVLPVAEAPAHWTALRWQFIPHPFDPASLVGQTVYAGLVVADARLQPPPGPADSWTLVGRVQNGGAGPARHITLHAALEDAAGTLLDGRYQFLSPDPLRAGAGTPFKLTFHMAPPRSPLAPTLVLFVDGQVP